MEETEFYIKSNLFSLKYNVWLGSLHRDLKVLNASLFGLFSGFRNSTQECHPLHSVFPAKEFMFG